MKYKLNMSIQATLLATEAQRAGLSKGEAHARGCRGSCECIGR